MSTCRGGCGTKLREDPLGGGVCDRCTAAEVLEQVGGPAPARRAGRGTGSQPTCRCGAALQSAQEHERGLCVDCAMEFLHDAEGEPDEDDA